MKHVISSKIIIGILFQNFTYISFKKRKRISSYKWKALSSISAIFLHNILSIAKNNWPITIL